MKGKPLATAVRTFCAMAFFLCVGTTGAMAQKPAFRALAFYSTNVEPDHVRTGKEGLTFSRFGGEEQLRVRHHHGLGQAQ